MINATHPITIVMLIMIGMCLGGIVVAAIVRREQAKQIEDALDSIGIRRQEFKKVSSEVDAIWRVLKQSGERIEYLEKFR